MSVYAGPRISTDGNVLTLDAANPKSYPGSGTTWTDMSTGKNNGTLVSGPTFSANNQGTINFDKVDDHISVTPIARTLSFTFEIVFKTSNTSTDGTVRQYLYTQQRNPPANGAYTYMDRQGCHISGDLVGIQYLNVLNNSFWAQTLPGTLLSNTWYHFVGTMSNGTCQIYLNGNPVTTLLQNVDNAYASSNSMPKIPSVPNQGFIGRRGDSQGEDRFGGSIAVLRDYTTALTADQVKQNFNALRGRFGI